MEISLLCLSPSWQLWFWNNRSLLKKKKQLRKTLLYESAGIWMCLPVTKSFVFTWMWLILVSTSRFWLHLAHRQVSYSFLYFFSLRKQPMGMSFFQKRKKEGEKSILRGHFHFKGGRDQPRPSMSDTLFLIGQILDSMKLIFLLFEINNLYL